MFLLVTFPFAHPPCNGILNPQNAASYLGTTDSSYLKLPFLKQIEKNMICYNFPHLFVFFETLFNEFLHRFYIVV